MVDILDRLKKVMVAEAEDNNFNACEYFETVLQHKDKLKPLLDDATNYPHVEIYYHEDDTEGYTNGYFTIRFGKNYSDCLDYEYKIELLRDPRHWGYCECQPSDEGYNPIYKCCGNGCDWTAPEVLVERINTVASFSFDGIERDMWELEKKWNGKEDLENEKLSLQLQYIDSQIERLIEEKQLIESKLK